MSRPKSASGPRADYLITLSDAERALIDDVRGTTPRATWIRQAAMMRAVVPVADELARAHARIMDAMDQLAVPSVVARVPEGFDASAPMPIVSMEPARPSVAEALEGLEAFDQIAITRDADEVRAKAWRGDTVVTAMGSALMVDGVRALALEGEALDPTHTA